MFASVRNRLAVLAAACLLTVATANQADAAIRFGMFKIVNNSGMQVNFQVRWGTGAWQNYSVAPGASQWFWLPIDQVASNPPEIRFDDALRPGIDRTRVYRLTTYGVVSEADHMAAKLYQFVREGSDRAYLDLQYLN